MKPLFKDNFSTQSEIYARYRPQYPKELFQYLSTLTPEHQIAWDCGTGNGQAAIGLVDYYALVLATDPSAEQIKHAFPHPNIQYSVASGESFSIADHSIDLITIANALHWFNLDVFYGNVRKVLKRNGILAAWAYGIPHVNDAIDSIIKQFHDGPLGEFWVHENRLVENEYRDLPFPFLLIPSPEFHSYKEFDLDEFLMYLNTWSATQKYISTYGSNPTVQLRNELLKYWKDPASKRQIQWKLILKIGKLVDALAKGE